MIPDRDTLAAEHVLGLLEGDERREAERLAESDPTFQASVSRWQSRFSELDRSAAPLPAEDPLWLRIEAALPKQEAPAPVADAAPVLGPNPVSAFRALWRSLPFWRAAGLAGAFASVLLAVGFGVMANRAARQPVLVAVLLTDQNRPAAVVNAFANGDAELVPLQAIDVPAGRALEIWTLWDRARGPVSVGLMDQARRVRLNVENLPKQPNQLFEISLEPATGSPTGRPTGPVLMKGITSQPL